MKLDPNTRNNDGETPLHKASENDIEKVKILLKRKVEINIKDRRDYFFVLLSHEILHFTMHAATETLMS